MEPKSTRKMCDKCHNWEMWRSSATWELHMVESYKSDAHISIMHRHRPQRGAGQREGVWGGGKGRGGEWGYL